jgi:hypothetical protein
VCLWSLPSSAHKEQTHGAASILAFEYLEWRSFQEGQGGSEFDGAGLTRHQLTEQLGIAYGDIDSDDRAKIVLGLEPGYVLDPGNGLDQVQAPSTRREPGLSGYYSSGTAEFPDAEGAFLAYLTATVDKQSDVWGTAQEPFEVVRDKVEGGAAESTVAQFVDGLINFPDTVADYAAAAGCAVVSIIPILGDVVCTILEAIADLVDFSTDVVAAIAALPFQPILEATTEDTVAGCGPAGVTMVPFISVVEALNEQIQRDISLEPQEKTYLANAIFADTAFYNDLLITNENCEESEDALEDMSALRVYGTPSSEAKLMLHMRARLADFIRSCKSQGKSIEDCVDDELIEPHMKSIYSWSLSGESVKREFPPQSDQWEEHWRRWRLDNNFTSTTHFLDIMSTVEPKAGTTDDPINFITDDITAMKSGDGFNGRFGKRHAFDGYSLSEGNRFFPHSELFDAAGMLGKGTARLEGPVGLEIIKKFDFPTMLELDEAIVENARKFKLRAASPTGYLLLRRRICDSDSPTLETEDGLAPSNCAHYWTYPNSFQRLTLVEHIMPPADLGALDGFVTWVYGQRPTELVDDRGAGHQYYDGFLSLLELYDRNGGTLTGGPYFCGVDTIKCPENTNVYWDNQTPNQPMNQAMRLRGLGVALHMVQDMTVPHHLAPATGFGHALYERWVHDYVWPVKPRSDNLELADAVTVCVCDGSATNTACSQGGECWDPTANPPQAKNGVFYEDIGDAQGNKKVKFDSVDDYWGYSPSGGNRNTELFEHVSVVDPGDPDYDPAFWEAVEVERGELIGEIDELALGESCPHFSTRRLMWATAFLTAKYVWNAAMNFTIDPGKDFVSFLGGASPEQRREAGFWLMTSSILRSDVLEDISPSAGSRGIGLWKAVADKTFPLMIAATAIMLENAAKVRAYPGNKNQVTCDFASVQQGNATSTAGLTENTCAEDRRRELMDCFGLAEVGASTADCDEYIGISRFDDCRGPQASSLDGTCGRAAAEIAACVCKESGDNPISSVASVNACTADNLTQLGNDDLFRAGKLDSPTYSFIRANDGCGGPQDTDGDCIPDTSDRCTNLGSQGAKWPDSDVPADICWYDDSQEGFCRYGCPRSLDPSGGE